MSCPYSSPPAAVTLPLYLFDKGDGWVASSVTWQSNKSTAIKSEKMAGNNISHSLALAYEGWLFSSGDLHFVWWNSFECLLRFFSCPSLSDMCCMRTASTSSRKHWQSLQVNRLRQPVKKQTCLRYLGGSAEVGQHLTLCVPHETHFFAFNLNIGEDILAIVWHWYGDIHTVHTQIFAYACSNMNDQFRGLLEVV